MVMGMVFLCLHCLHCLPGYWSGAAGLLARVGIDGIVALCGLLVGGVVLMDGLGGYADYPVGFIMESPLADAVVRIGS